MPMKPRRACAVSLCGRDALAAGSYCQAHARTAFQADNTTRLRGRALQRKRRELFDRTPLCALCQAAGRVTVATIRDHVVPIGEGGSDDDSNTQALCLACSDIKTAAESERGRRRVRAETA